MGLPVYALPTNFNSIYFEASTGAAFNGTLTIFPTRVTDGWNAWGYSGADPSIPTTSMSPITYLLYHIVDGYITETGNALVHDTIVQYLDYTYDLQFDFNDGRQATTTVTSTGQPNMSMPDMSSPYTLPETAKFSVELTVNVSPESPHTLDLYVDGLQTGTGTSQMTYSGLSSVFSVHLREKVLFQKAVASGAMTVNLGLSSSQKQIPISDIEIVDGEITNKTGRALPEIVLKSLL